MIPESAAAVTQEYLRLVDATAPQLIEGLYLVGSIALSDFQQGHSNVDFVAVTSEPLSNEQVAALQTIHETLGSRLPHFDDLYLHRTQLACDPPVLSPPYSSEGSFHPSGGFEANPAVWRTLALYGIGAVRAPYPLPHSSRTTINAKARTSTPSKSLKSRLTDYR